MNTKVVFSARRYGKSVMPGMLAMRSLAMYFRELGATASSNLTV